MSRRVVVASVTGSALGFALQVGAFAETPNSQSLVQSGYAMLARGEYPNAVRTLAAAVRTDPKDRSARRYLAHALVRSGNSSLAIEQFMIVEKMAPLEAPDQAALGDAYRSLGNLRAAATGYGKAAQMNPHLEVAWAGLAKTYDRAGQYKTAVALCQQGMRQANNWDSWKYLVAVLRELGQRPSQSGGEPAVSDEPRSGTGIVRSR